jgi:hypothetical protein
MVRVRLTGGKINKLMQPFSGERVLKVQINYSIKPFPMWDLCVPELIV